MADRIQIRGGTGSEWTTANPILAHREIGIEMGSPSKIKIGDGATDWNSLGYIAADGSAVWGSISGKPTTISGYGITDAFTQTAADLLYSATGHTHAFSALTSKPTTLSGYGITDAYPLTGNPSGFLTAESDPAFMASAASGILGSNITNWNSAFGWGNHASAGYLTSASASSTYLPLSTISGMANPSASIGLTAANGSAITAMRSDATPALSQGIIPTWTSLHTWGSGTDALTIDPTGHLQYGNATARPATISTARVLNGVFVNGHHGIEDHTSLDNTGTLNAYASFDAQPIITGAQSYDHFVGFQSRPELQGSASISSRFEAFNAGLVNNTSGAISSATGVRILDVSGTGVGAIASNFGLRIADMTKGVLNYAIFTGLGAVSIGDVMRVAGTVNHFGMTMIGSSTAPTLTTGLTIKPANASGALKTGMRIYQSGGSAGAGSSIELGYSDAQTGCVVISGYSDALTGRAFSVSTNTSTSVAVEVFKIAPTGQPRFNLLGVGTFTGTAAYGLAVTSAGNIIEVASVTGGSITWPGAIYTTPTTGVVTTGNLSFSPALATQTANTILSGPGSGGAATPTFRALVAADIPSLSYVSSTGTTGDINSYSATNTPSRITAVATGYLLGSQGTGTLPAWLQAATLNTSLTTPLLIGNTTSGGTLTLQSTSNATKGKILFGTSAYDEVNNRFGIGLTLPLTQIHIGGGSQSAVQTIATYQGIYVNPNSANTQISMATTNNVQGGMLLDASRMYVGSYSTSHLVLISNNADRMIINGSTGNIAIGSNALPSAYLHIKAGTATAGTAPLKLTGGTNLSVTEAGAMEFDGTHLYFTIANAGTRYQLDQQSAASGITIGTSAITSGTTGRVLYDNAGVIGEMTTTGTGTVLALATSPTFVTPTLGAATATTINGHTFTAGSSIFTGTAAQTYTFPATTSNIGVMPRTVSVSGSTVTTTSDVASDITGLTLSVEANKKYRVIATLLVGCDNTGGVRFSLNGPASSAVKSGSFIGTGTNNITITSLPIPAMGTLTGNGTSSFCKANAATGNVTMIAEITTGATAGNVKLQYASTTLTQTSSVFIGSTIEIVEVL